MSAAPLFVDATEAVLSVLPFVVRRRVKWGDCDPAGVVYTGRFSDYVLGAVSLFFRGIAGEPWHDFNRRLDIDTPCKALSFEFQHALWPEEEFDMTVSVAAVRTRSFDLGVVGRRTDGPIAFNATMSPICIARGERRSVAIPAPLLEKLAPHRQNAE